MPDNGTAASGPTIAWDEIGGVAYQRIKLALGPDGTYTADVDGSAARGFYVDPRRKVVRLSQTPTVSTTPAYTAKDAVGGLMTFAGAVRASGGSGILQAVQVVDKGQQMKDLDLVLFDRTITAPTDNAIFAPSDTEVGYIVDVVPIGGWADFSTNAVFSIPRATEFVLNGTDLFGVLVSRSVTGPTYTSTSDLVVSLTIGQD